jgi:hypothetical protein
LRVPAGPPRRCGSCGIGHRLVLEYVNDLAGSSMHVLACTFESDIFNLVECTLARSAPAKISESTVAIS